MSEGSLYPYQRDAVAKLLALNGQGGCFAEMGTGKTRMILAVAQELKAKRILVPLPLFATTVWREEIELFSPEIQTLDCTRGSIDQRAAALKKADGKRPIAVFVGYESYWREPLRSTILEWKPDFVPFDEAHKLMGRSTRQSQFAALLARDDPRAARSAVPYRVGLTGTPAPNGPHDYYPVVRGLDPTVFGTR